MTGAAVLEYFQKTEEDMMQLQLEAGYESMEGGVCAAAGFSANGCNCGLNPDKNKNDLGMIYSGRLCNAAAVYTSNRVKGAPILVTKKNLEATGGKARAVIVNSKNANTCNPDGEQKAWRMCELAAGQLRIKPEEVVVASTGVIGQVLPIEPVESHIAQLAAGLAPEHHEAAATAIMTTDTVKKEAAVSFELNGRTCHLGGMAKGSGMIHPDMATTLNFITTDAAVSAALLQKALRDTVKVTYNCLSIDGDTSTNDMVLVLANGAAGNEEVSEEGPAYEILKKALYLVLLNLTRMLAADGEGASKLLECRCTGAPDFETAVTAAKSVISSSLVKCAMSGADANCGRILCAIGYSGAQLDVGRIDVELASAKGRILVCRDGNGIAFSEEAAAEILSEDEIAIHVSLNQGSASATAWGCDMTYDYVKINADYRS